MITTEEYNKCIDFLSRISYMADSSNMKKMALDVGYVIKREYDKDCAEQSRLKNGDAPLDASKLLEDNRQLYDNNQRLIKANSELQSLLNSKANELSIKMDEISHKILMLQ